MTSLKKTLDVLINVLFDATPSGVSKTLLKSAVDAIEPAARTWEELYLDAFQAAVEDMRPQLEKYAGPDGEVGLDEGRLLKALQGELSVHDLAESDLRSDAFLNELTQRLLALDALYLGGSQLSEADTRQLVRNLVRQHAPAQFKAAVEQNEAAFRQALRREALKTSAGLDSVQAYLAEHFDLVLAGLAAVREDVAEHRAETHDEHAAIREDIADVPRRVADEMIARGAADLAPPRSYSAFLSYAWKDDKPFVEKLYADLRAAGVTVWWDETDMQGRGNTLRKEIKEGIQQAARFVPVIGPLAARKAATPGTNINLEWDHARQLCKAVTPVLRKGELSLIPPDFACNLWFDFRDDTEYEVKFAQLLDRLREPPALPGTLRGGPWRAVPVRALPRMELVVEIRDKLQADDPLPVGSSGTAGVVLVHGPAGLGKSILATVVAYDCEVRRGFPDGVVWIEVGRGTTAEELRIRIGAAFGVQAEQMQSPADLTALLYDKDCLLILDDAWEQAPVEQCLVPGPDLRYLVTSRRARLLNLLEKNYVRLGYLSDEEGAELIARRLGFEVAAPDGDEEPDWPDRMVHKEIAGELDGHLQAIAICAARLASRDATSPADLLEDLRKGDSALLEALRRDIEDESREGNFLRSFTLSYEALSPEMQRRFRLLGAFAEGGSFEAEAAAAVWEEENNSRALRYLVDRALLDEAGQDRYTLHLLSHAAARTLLKQAGEQDDAALRHAEYYARRAARYSDSNSAKALFVDLPNLITAFDTARALNSSHLMYRIAWNAEQALVLQGEWTRLEDWLTVTLASLTGDDESDQSRRAELNGALADLAAKRGDWAAAETLNREALAAFQVLGDRQGVAVSQGKLADLAAKRGDWAAAETLNREALAVFEALGDRREIAVQKGRLADLAAKRGDWDAVETLRTGVLREYQALGDRRGVAVSQGALADLVANRGDWDAAERLHLQALATAKAIGDWQGVAVSQGWLANLAANRGDWDAADRLYREALAAFETHGDRRGVAVSQGALANLAADRGNWGAAETLHREALAAFKAVGDPHGVAISQMQLGQILIVNGNKSEGCQLMAVSQAALEVMGARHEARIVAGIMEQAGCRGDAAVRRQVLSDEQVQVLLNNTLAVLGPAAARKEEWHEALVGLQQQALAADDPETAGFVAALLRLLDEGLEATGVVTPAVPGAYRAAWDALVDYLKS